MSFIAENIKFFKSASGIGGAISSEIITNTLENIFDDVYAADAKKGDTEYRLIYVKNTHNSSTLYRSKVYIESNTPSVNDTIQIGKAAAGLNKTETAINNEDTTPVNVAFLTPADFDSGVPLGDIAAGEFFGIWIKRIVDKNSTGYTDNNFAIEVKGETSWG